MSLEQINQYKPQARLLLISQREWHILFQSQQFRYFNVTRCFEHTAH